MTAEQWLTNRQMAMISVDAVSRLGAAGVARYPLIDSLMRNTPDALAFIDRAEQEGVRAVVADRDGSFGDYSQALPELHPDPAHVIEP